MLHITFPWQFKIKSAEGGYNSEKASRQKRCSFSLSLWVVSPHFKWKNYPRRKSLVLPSPVVFHLITKSPPTDALITHNLLKSLVVNRKLKWVRFLLPELAKWLLDTHEGWMAVVIESFGLTSWPCEAAIPFLKVQLPYNKRYEEAASVNQERCIGAVYERNPPRSTQRHCNKVQQPQ